MAAGCRVGIAGTSAARELAAPKALDVTPKKGNWAATPQESTQKFHVERHQQYVERAKQGDIDVLFLGDSITQLWEQSGRLIWKERYEPLKAANFGIGGQNTMQILWRINSGELDGINPKVVVLMAGTNNMGMHDADQIADALRVMVNSIRLKLPQSKILLLGLLPKVVEAGDRREKVRQVNAVISKLDNGKTVRYLDIGDKFLLFNGDLNKEMMPDGVHPNAKGYAAWGEAMQPLLDQMLKSEAKTNP
jgi:lysophospholipase L1-like esterase